MGQETAKSFLLRSALEHKCPSGYLFEGPPGVGKRTAAMELGRVLNCVDSGDPECKCPSCILCNRGSHPDVEVVCPEVSVFTVDTVRELRDRALYRPYMGKWKVLILDDADKMNQEAANAFLKILEEPPGPTLFIVLSEGGGIIPTLSSRCVHVPFFLLREAQIRDILSRLRGGALAGDCELFCSLASGQVSRALSYADQTLWLIRASSLSLFLRLWNANLAESLQWMSEMGTKAQEVREKLDHFQSFIRDVWLLKLGRDALVRNRDIVSELEPLCKRSSEVLAYFTQRTNELVRLLGRSTVEVQLRSYVCSIMLAIQMG